MRYLPGIILPFLVWGIGHAAVVTVAVKTANLKDNPTEVGAYVVAKVPRYYPLAIQSERGEYYEIRDFENRNGWILKKQVSTAKGVVVNVKRANIRKGPGFEYPIIFKAYRGVAFKVLATKDGWLNVRHENGREGWVAEKLTWGK